MRLRRIIRNVLLALVAVVAFVLILAGSLWLYFHPSIQRIPGVVYGQRHGKGLTMDVLQPAKPNGIGIVLMVSGGWRSSAGSFKPWIAAPLLRRGYTIFAVYHVPQPEATVMEFTDDVNRAVRYVRYNAAKYKIDAQRLGVTGGSAGGHLSLMVATRGGPGPADAPDPLDRESSAVQAVAIFYPVTDLLNLGDSTENGHDGGPPTSFKKAFGPDAEDTNVWRVIGHELSPIYYISSNLPPTLIYHGDADTLVPMDQSQRFQAKAQELGRTVKLVIHHKGQHGWLSMVWDLRRFGDWFDRYLRQPSK